MSENDKIPTKDETRGIRREQISDKNISIHTHSSKRASGESGRPGHLCERIPGAGGERENPFGSIDRDFIRRSIARTSRRLEEAKHYVSWYKKQVSELSAELDELEQLNQLADDTDPQPSSGGNGDGKLDDLFGFTNSSEE